MPRRKRQQAKALPEPSPVSEIPSPSLEPEEPPDVGARKVYKNAVVRQAILGMLEFDRGTLAVLMRVDQALMEEVVRVLHRKLEEAVGIKLKLHLTASRITPPPSSPLLLHRYRSE